MRPGIPRAAILTGMILGFSTMGSVCICSPDTSGESPEVTTECGEGPAPAEGEATLVLANPDTGLPLAEGEVLQVHYGDQGGRHVYALVQQHATGKAAWTYAMKFIGTTYDGTEGEVGSNTAIVDLCAPGWTETTVPVFLYGEPGEVTLQILATTEAGAELTDEIKVVLVAP